MNKQRARYGETKGERKKDREGRSPDRDLPIENYQGLTVDQITRRLKGCSEKQLKRLKAYEEDHKHRKTPLTKLSKRLQQQALLAGRRNHHHTRHRVRGYMSSPYAVVTLSAHALAVMAALVALRACGAAQAPPVSAGRVSLERVAASLLAVSLTVLLEMIYGVVHPLAPATTLLVTLGIVSGSRRDWVTLLAGITLIALLGQLTRN